jgi:cytochrome c peroxidase
MEMSCGGKNFAQLGKKILTLKPLSNQTVDASDSVLGPYAQPGNGLKPIHTYKLWIQRAFNNAYWEASDKQLINGYQLIENNFSLFWGLAVQAYESTLIANDSRFDQAQEDLANGLDKLTEQEQRGLNLFINQGKCVACHLGPELTAASISHVENLENSADIGKYIERMVMGDGGVALYDAGFYNIGVRPTVEDLGAGGRDPYGFPLSFTRNAKLQANPPYDPYDPQAFLDDSNISSLAPDPIKTNSLLFAASFEPVAPDERDAVDGSFKVPGLRNIELTGPYFHNGGQATLEQVIHFYNRGGDRKDLFQKDPDCGGPLLVEGMLVPDPETGMLDDSGYFSPEGGNPSNIAADMAGSRELLDSVCGSDDSQHLTLRLSKSDVDDLVAFLKTLTDERVRWEKAPFDHPSLKIANGHMGNENQVKFDKKTNQAVEQFITLPAIGSAGRKAKGLPPLKSFASQLR